MAYGMAHPILKEMMKHLEKLSEKGRLSLLVAVDLISEMLKLRHKWDHTIRRDLNKLLDGNFFRFNEKVHLGLKELVNGRGWIVRSDIDPVKQMAFEMVSTMSASELEEYDIKVMDNLEAADNMLKKMKETGGTLPVYLDVENTYNFLGEQQWRSNKKRARAALVTILDPKSKEILLWRVHKQPEMDAVEVRLRKLSLHRKILTWGKEEILKWIPNKKDIQRKKFRKLMSLKSAAEEAGLYLLKLETMSNWTNEILRQDQIIYAALDCVAMVWIAEHFKIPIDLPERMPSMDFSCL
ncbi:unnamed protein product [Caenorhabditis nigoni]